MSQAAVVTGRAAEELGAQTAAAHTSSLRHWGQRRVPYGPQAGVLTANRKTNNNSELSVIYSIPLN